MKAWSPITVNDLSASMVFPAIRLTDTATSSKKVLTKKKQYRMYVCGITPYDATHLGHAATYLSFDLIHRLLLASGAKVNYVQNITDIDEPLLERANRDGVKWDELAADQIELFRKDMTALQVIPPTSYVGAIESIPLVTQAIDIMSSNKSTYEVDKDLYFSVNHDGKFGSLSHLTQSEMLELFSQRGGDPTLSGKRDPLDCLIWMQQRPNEPGWSSTHGSGRPGWHIECTAIAMEFLKPDSAEEELIDIQGGGSDLIFPHHEMCAAQARAISGKELATHYVHAGMIGLDGEKMSKSKGNLVFVSSLLASGIDPFAIRWALMSDHYKSERMWNNELLDQAAIEVEQLNNVMKSQTVAPTDQLAISIIEFLSDDLDTSSVVKAINKWVNASLNGETGGDYQQISAVLKNLLGFSI
ncbi:MAG: cysteine--1-D-myo-inosityl 2-amino-2-deoxy-alpha-D-glucopyranoside ligase [Actinobacteria bacterium]|nr:cysteine--1-D-myo-inosityl 2-amino-2-deoxy-alpha-D-glucopyranoside ligase [Actinomycetota bacterium]MSZ12923.1 cysteine--1-D-myo-inosityl 2-amino-2-deoxy-alpha-D-glucopyranoside ligase [Actinomycetota bacterium]MSZ27716.1 cysteine--1-D-myo-inosityl 2-amino-2-deoxy-alpha-D-glucopyranoside ligase [Actinomycetota bacterium]